MEISQLRYFRQVAQSQHMTRSAEKLHIAQPALTKSIHKLEEELEVPLFVNRGRNIVLTEYGKYLLQELTPILEDLDRLPEKVRSMAKTENETVRLRVAAASTLVTEAVIEYKKQHRKVNFKLIQEDVDSDFDISVTTRSFHDIPKKKTEDETVFGEEIFLAVPHTHPLAKRRSIRLEEAAGEDFISLMGSRPIRNICDKFCSLAGFEPRVIFESDSPAAVRNMIAANVGVGFWPEFTWGRIDSDMVRLLPIKAPVCRRDIVLTERENKADGKYVKDFLLFLSQYCDSIRKGTHEI